MGRPALIQQGCVLAKKLPSPCVDVCKYKRQGHCIACSMTKAQKSLSKQLKTDKHRTALLEMLMAQQKTLGGFPAWSGLYLKKCLKKKVEPPECVTSPEMGAE